MVAYAAVELPVPGQLNVPEPISATTRLSVEPEVHFSALAAKFWVAFGKTCAAAVIVAP